MTEDVASDGLQQTVLDLQAALAASEAKTMEKVAELTQIRALMHQVTVYEGLVDVSPLVMMVSDLVKDHDSLEGRIDQAILAIKGLVEGPKFTFSHEDLKGIAHLLRGGSPVPDDLSELDG